MVYNFSCSCCDDFSLANRIVAEKFNQVLNSVRVFAGAQPRLISATLNRKKKMSKLAKGLGIGCATIIGVVVIGLIIIGSIVPDTAGYTGRQIPKKYMATIRSLYLLEEDEQIRYFYSDAMLDITAGLYFVTDRNLVLYSKDWVEPEIIIPFYEIASVDTAYSDFWADDSIVYVTTHSGTEVSFPVSCEKGLDRKFVQVINESLDVQPGAAAAQ